MMEVMETNFEGIENVLGRHRIGRFPCISPVSSCCDKSSIAAT